ncbi:MAG TPA: S8 family serine peptidase [Actinophytocola sp.]|uniref:S8 family peptidase n=1 Tax=Actinophytocola sp. TaxID=1872138 RepID=UPI002DB7DAD8|nr:S8 family serine peptidase [Actinophytocola sp.]HEU5470131.1 S8 family serine peptidase [Actinophytocola sp.]
MAEASPNGDCRPTDPRRAPSQTITIPGDVLARHGLRILDPSTCVRDWNGRRPESTVYRADTLLIPVRDAESFRPDRNDYDPVLEGLGIRLRPPDDPRWRERLGALPNQRSVPVPLVARDPIGREAPDPWAALVALRTRFPRERGQGVVLDHGVYSAAVQGAPFSGGGSVGTPFSGGGGLGDPQSMTSGLTLYTGSRNPVQFLGAPPVRPPAKSLAGGRRPVVAVLDTGIGRHPWLTIGDRGSTGYDPYVPIGDMTTDPVVEVSLAFQQALAAADIATATASGTTATDPLDSPCEVRDWIDPLLGLTDSHAGHGTFVTGLIHQVCPQARVLSLRVLHSDGFSTEGSLLFALEWLRQRVAAAQSNNRPDELVDVVSLSLGFYAETATPDELGQVADAVRRLTDLGVLVIAAAGNDATTRPFLPAALGLGNEMLAAVGARNASGITTAAFSNWGEWISRWAPGNAMVSTVPVWQGPREGGLVYPDAGGLGPRWRTAPDDDDLTTGFAVWAGTSFATPVVSATVALQIATSGGLTMPRGSVEQAMALMSKVDERLIGHGWMDQPDVPAEVSAAGLSG